MKWVKNSNFVKRSFFLKTSPYYPNNRTPYFYNKSKQFFIYQSSLRFFQNNTDNNPTTKSSESSHDSTNKSSSSSPTNNSSSEKFETESEPKPEVPKTEKSETEESKTEEYKTEDPKTEETKPISSETIIPQSVAGVGIIQPPKLKDALPPSHEYQDKEWKYLINEKKNEWKEQQKKKEDEEKKKEEEAKKKKEEKKQKEEKKFEETKSDASRTDVETTTTLEEFLSEEPEITQKEDELPIETTKELTEEEKFTDENTDKTTHEESQKQKTEEKKEEKVDHLPIKYKPSIWWKIQELFGTIMMYPNYYLHIANLAAIVGMFMQEILLLRLFSVGANIMAAVFYFKMTPKLLSALFWTIFFAIGHSFMIFRLLLERRTVEMTDEEHEVYVEAFREYGFTPVQFKKIMSIAKYRRVDPGNILCKQGHEEKRTIYIIKGGVEMKQNNEVVGFIDAGCFVGELLDDINLVVEDEEVLEPEEEPSKVLNTLIIDEIENSEKSGPNKNNEVTEDRKIHDEENDNKNMNKKESKEMEMHEEKIKGKTSIFRKLFQKDEETLKQWKHTIVASEPCQILVWNKKGLNDLLKSNDRLTQSAIKAMYGDMKNKLEANRKFQTIKSYYDILKVITYDDIISNETKKQLDKYREDNDITLLEHEKALHKIGWTLEDYENGKKHYVSLLQKFNDWYQNSVREKWSIDEVN